MASQHDKVVVWFKRLVRRRVAARRAMGQERMEIVVPVRRLLAPTVINLQMEVQV